MRSGQVAKILGVSDSLVRKIEREGAIGSVPRDRAGQRRFNDQHVAELRAIIYGRKS